VSPARSWVAGKVTSTVWRCLCPGCRRSSNHQCPVQAVFTGVAVEVHAQAGRVCRPARPGGGGTSDTPASRGRAEPKRIVKVWGFDPAHASAGPAARKASRGRDRCHDEEEGVGAKLGVAVRARRTRLPAIGAPELPEAWRREPTMREAAQGNNRQGRSETARALRNGSICPRRDSPSGVATIRHVNRAGKDAGWSPGHDASRRGFGRVASVAAPTSCAR